LNNASGWAEFICNLSPMNHIYLSNEAVPISCILSSKYCYAIVLGTSLTICDIYIYIASRSEEVFSRNANQQVMQRRPEIMPHCITHALRRRFDVWVQRTQNILYKKAIPGPLSCNMMNGVFRLPLHMIVIVLALTIMHHHSSLWPISIFKTDGLRTNV
jgi:hypothetical protein